MSFKRKHTAPEDTSQKRTKSNFFTPQTSTVRDNQQNPPLTFIYTPREAGTIRLVTWNVNGIKSLDEKVLKKYLEAENPDIMILTETKYSKGKPDIICLKSRFKYQVWGTDPKPGHAGTAILSNTKPLGIVVGLPNWKNPVELAGRYVEFEFEYMFIVGTYVPNSGESLQRMDLKREWNTAFKSHIRELDTKKPVIWAGDFNCIPDKKDIDLTARSFWDKIGGLSEEERTDFNEITNPADEKHPTFVDAWRHLHPQAEEYTHSSPKFGAWRLDSFVVSKRILGRLASCVIRHNLRQFRLSDHWPVTLDISTAL